jgi:hypothetical protein
MAVTHLRFDNLLTRWGRSGNAAIEFALAAPILFILLIGTAEVGLVMYHAMQVHNSVEAGALYAMTNGFDPPGIAAAVANSTGTQGIVTTPVPQSFCGCPDAGGLLAAPCDSQCADGGPPGQYVRINAALAHQTILPYPGLPLPTTLTAQSIVRLN